MRTLKKIWKILRKLLWEFFRGEKAENWGKRQIAELGRLGGKLII